MKVMLPRTTIASHPCRMLVVYKSQLKWQDVSIQSLLLLLYLSDSNCIKMMELGVVPYILDLLEHHVDEGDVSVQHAGLSALRNLAIPGITQFTTKPHLHFFSVQLDTNEQLKSSEFIQVTND